MTDPTVKPVPNAPPRRRDRLGWWHELCRSVLLLGHETAPPPPLPVEAPEAVRELIERIEDHRSRFADAARALGADYKGGYWMMYLVAPLAVCCAALASAVPRLSVGLSGAEFLLIVSIIALFLLMRRAGWQERWVRSRRTAEHLRYLPLVAPFVRNHKANWYQDLATARGIRIVVDEEVTRVCRWLGHTNAAHGLLLTDRASYAGYLRYVDSLLTQQIRYHADKAATEQTLTRRISLASTFFFAVTVVCTALLFLENLSHAIGLDRYLPPHYLRLLATVLPAIGAGLRGLLAQGESHRVAALSEGMSVRLAQLRDQVRRLPADESSRESLEDVVWNSVQELLSEADTWMRLQESVPLSVAG